jgi:hypothetical protein
MLTHQKTKTPRITRILLVHGNLFAESVVIRAIRGVYCFGHLQLLMSARIEANLFSILTAIAGLLWKFPA